MDLETAIAILKEERAARKARQDADFMAEMAERLQPENVESTKAIATEAMDLWHDKWKEARAAFDDLLQPFGLTRLDLAGII